MGAFYNLFVPKQAVGQSLVYFDFFNATGSGLTIAVHHLVPIVSGAVAVTQNVGIDLHLTRTSAVGTGGTAATRNGTDTTACTISGINHTQALDALVTARLTPSGGATAGAVLSWCSVLTEETLPAAYVPQSNLVRQIADVPALIVSENTGFRVIQGAVASVGNIGFNVVFEARQ